MSLTSLVVLAKAPGSMTSTRLFVRFSDSSLGCVRKAPVGMRPAYREEEKSRGCSKLLLHSHIPVHVRVYVLQVGLGRFTTMFSTFETVSNLLGPPRIVGVRRTVKILYLAGDFFYFFGQSFIFLRLIFRECDFKLVMRISRRFLWETPRVVAAVSGQTKSGYIRTCIFYSLMRLSCS